MSLETSIIGDEALDGFSGTLRGSLVRPDDEIYDEGRTVWNGMIDKRPALIVQCTGTADIVATVDFARENDIFGRFEQLGEFGETTPSVI